LTIGEQIRLGISPILSVHLYNVSLEVNICFVVYNYAWQTAIWCETGIDCTVYRKHTLCAFQLALYSLMETRI